MHLYCLANVYTDHTNKYPSITPNTIYKIMEGHTPIRVRTMNEETGEQEFTQVIAVSHDYVPTRVIKGKYNRHTCCSDDTQLLTKDGWKRADQIAIGDKLKLGTGRYLIVQSIQNDREYRSGFNFKLLRGTNIVTRNAIVRVDWV